LGDWIGIRGEQIGCHGTNGALRWLPTASLAEISLFVESGKESESESWARSLTPFFDYR